MNIYRSIFVFLIVAIFSVAAAGCTLFESKEVVPSPPEEDLSPFTFEDGVLKMVSPGNAFALLVHSLDIDEVPDEIVAEVRIRHLEGPTGASWAPAVYLYWTTNRWIAVRNRQNPDEFRIQVRNGSSMQTVTGFETKPVMGEWNGIRIVWRNTSNDAEIYASAKMDEWELLTTLPMEGQGLPWILLGKGFQDTTRRPFLADSYAEDHGAIGTTLLSGFKLIVDGEEYISDDFDGNRLDESVWTPLFEGDPDLDDKIDNLLNAYGGV